MQEHAGEVKYVTLAGEGDFVEDCDAYVEFGTTAGVIGALKMEQQEIKGKPITVSDRECTCFQVVDCLRPLRNTQSNTEAKISC